MAYSTRLPKNLQVRSLSATRGKDRVQYKISLTTSEPEPFVRLERYGRGGGGRAKYHKVRERYIDDDLRIFAGFEAVKEGGVFYQYVIIGQLQVLPPKEGLV